MGARLYWCADDYVADAALAGPGPFEGARLFVLAADHDRIVAEAEARGWNAGVGEARRAAASTPLHSESPFAWEIHLAVWADIDAAIAALRKDAP